MKLNMIGNSTFNINLANFAPEKKPLRNPKKANILNETRKLKPVSRKLLEFRQYWLLYFWILILSLCLLPDYFFY